MSTVMSKGQCLNCKVCNQLTAKKGHGKDGAGLLLLSATVAEKNKYVMIGARSK
jgi:hypothetical protein